jgi:hypothetical protein
MRPVPQFGNSGAVLLALLLPPAVHAQTPQASALPANLSTSTTVSDAAPALHHPEITYGNGMLTVSAAGAGLNGIIHEIARQTGMHVSGSVADLPVFGTYGPAAPSEILSTLLDGTGNNILLVDATATTPAQLTLTRRTGGVTPPDPNAAAAEESDTQEIGNGRQQLGRPIPLAPQQSTMLPGQPGAPDANTANQTRGGAATNPNGSQPSSTEQPVVFPAVGATGTPATGSTTPANPDQPANNGVKTPQQIFEQLQRLRQQQQQNSNQ